MPGDQQSVRFRGNEDPRETVLSSGKEGNGLEEIRLAE
jgi:hypothetical protein